MTAATDNPARVLHDILRTIVSSPSSINDLWKSLLGATPGMATFAERHSEVVGVWQQVHDLLEALPPGDHEREQYLQYMPHYYNVIVNPADWAASRGSSTGEMVTIDHLTGIALALKYRALASPPITGDAIARLRTSIDEWHSILDEADFDEKFATELRAQVDHLLWLLDNVPLLGTRPVVEASKKLVGTGVAAMATKPSWAKRIGQALAPAFVVMAVLQTGIDDVNGILEGVADMKDTVVEILSPQKQIEGPPDVAQIEGSPTEKGGGNGEVVDAEFEVLEDAASEE